MAVRRPLIGLLDRGADPKIPHTKFDKKGNLVVASQPAVSAPVIAQKPEVKENLLKSETSPNLLTEETNESSEVEKDKKPMEKPKVDPKKPTDKTPKPV